MTRLPFDREPGRPARSGTRSAGR